MAPGVSQSIGKITRRATRGKKYLPRRCVRMVKGTPIIAGIFSLPAITQLLLLVLSNNGILLWRKPVRVFRRNTCGVYLNFGFF